MTTKEFIEKAIEGGWGGECANCKAPWFGHKQTRIGNRYCTVHPDLRDALLDPEAWKAVGKVSGWDESYFHVHAKATDYELYKYDQCWLMNMHRMIDALAEGKSIDEFLLQVLS